jgi:multiple sugar transport system substrate-binding protein
MGNRSTDRLDVLQRTSSRRSLLRRGAGGAAALAAAGVLGPRLGLAQQGTPMAQGTPALPTFTKSAKITCWGFGEEKTNPVGRSRVEAFRKAYPSIDLTLVPQWDDQKLLTAAASGNVPDVLWVGRSSIATWASKNVITPLDDRLNGSTIDLSEYYDAAVKECKYQDKMYGVPQFMDVRALYVNNDALSEVGSSSDALKTGDWEQLTDLGGKLVKKNGSSIERWGFDHKIQAGHLWIWGWANDGSFMNDDATKITYNDPKVVEALDWGVKTYDAQGGYQA